MRHLVLVGALALTACAGADSEVELRQQSLDGEAAPDANGVVSVVATGGAGVSTCTGVLLAPNLVLTSRNCIGGVDRDFVICGETKFRPPHDPADVQVTAAPVISAQLLGTTPAVQILVPDDDSACGNDVALVITEQPVPDGAPLAPRLDAPASPGESYSAYGYGPTTFEASNSGRRRVAHGLTVECVVGGCPTDAQVVEGEFFGSVGPLEADGGGPAVDENGLVLGITVRSGQDGSVYSAVASWAEFLTDGAQQAALAGQYDAPDWAGGSPEEPDMGGGEPDVGMPETDAGQPIDSTPDSSTDDEGCSTTSGAPAWPALFILLGAFLRRRG